jgi:hypothetical protein
VVSNNTNPRLTQEVPLENTESSSGDNSSKENEIYEDNKKNQ